MNAMLYPIIPHVSAQGAWPEWPCMTTSKSDEAWPAESPASTAEPFTVRHSGALSSNEYHLSPLTCSMQTPSLFSVALAHFHSW